ncbi:MAG TPA: flagellar filament capping protein FliD [Candidatus Baltobacteraceae bacterium]|nr:flagellar filament capping protein FliD [Candidatus Baltobacteraceae bacterium]
MSFPGIASGIDYNSIITKLTSLTLAPTTQLNQQIATLNAANAELIKINGLLSTVQDSLNGLSLSAVYNAISATSSNPAVLTAQGISGATAAPGTYTIKSVTLATATQVLSSAFAGHSELDALGASTGDKVALADSYAAVTPSNGSGTQGSITINGVTVNYDVKSQSIDTIFANINSAVRTATGDASFTIGFVSGTDTVQITDANKPISLGSANDQGNLLQVLRLDTAQIVNGASSGSVTGTAGVGGINQAKMFNSANSSGTATNADYKTAVTTGSFTINGVSISVDATKDNLASVLTRINASSAGVLATYDSTTGRITLTNKSTGATSIVLGASGDTSNFLSATGLTAGSGATTTLGTQASVTFQDSGGSTHTVYSNSNTVTTAIPGVQLNLLSNTTTSFQVTVGQDTSKLVSAVNTFVSAYNAAISEIDTATAPPIVPQSAVGASVGVPQTHALGGGVLFGDADVEMVKDQLVNMVSAYLPNASGYTSLSQLGLNLTSSFTQLAANSSSSGSSSNGTSTGSSGSAVTTQTVQGTDGQLTFDSSKLIAAFTANASAVQNLLAGTQGVVTQMGTYLTGVTGLPTQTEQGFLGSIPSISLLQGFENSNSSQITSIQQQIQQIRDNANQQADALRNEFVATETAIAGYQSLQSQLGSMFSSGGH